MSYNYDLLPEQGEIWRHKKTGMKLIIVNMPYLSTYSSALYVKFRESGSRVVRQMEVDLLQEHYYCENRHYEALMERIKELMAQ